jgi:anti-sigma factor RsiW
MTTDACREFESSIARAADETLGAGEQAALDAHLRTCAACQAALADQRAVRAVLAARPVLRAQPGFADRVTAAIDADRSWLGRLDFRVWTWRLVPVAAALMLVTWVVLRDANGTTGTTAPTTNATGETALASDLPVAAALWDSSMSDTAVLSLMLRANANDKLADSIKEP